MPETRHQFQEESDAELRDADGQVISKGRAVPLFDYGRFHFYIHAMTPLDTILRSAKILALPGIGLRLDISDIRDSIEEIPHDLYVLVTTSLYTS